MWHPRFSEAHRKPANISEKMRKNRFDFNTAEQGLTRMARTIAQLMHTTLQQTYLADTSFTLFVITFSI